MAKPWAPTEKQRWYLLRALKAGRAEPWGRGSNWTVKPLIERGLMTKHWHTVGYVYYYVKLTDAGRALAESLDG